MGVGLLSGSLQKQRCLPPGSPCMHVFDLSRFISISFRSLNLCSLVFGKVHILLIRIARLKCIFSWWWGGWHDEDKRYMFLSMGFLYRSRIILPLSMEQELSRKGIELFSEHEHFSDKGSKKFVVCDIVNFMLGCMRFIWSNISWSSFVVPVYILNKSS